MNDLQRSGILEETVGLGDGGCALVREAGGVAGGGDLRGKGLVGGGGEM